MFCKNCGKEVKDGAAFCPYCGTSFAAAQPAPQQAPVQPQVAPAQPQPQVTPQQTPVQPQPQNVNYTQGMPYVAPAYKQPSDIFPNMGKWIKGFFSKRAVANLDEIVHSQSLAGLIGLLFEVCAAALLVAVIPAKISSSLGYFAPSAGDILVSFFGSFFKQYIFIALIALAIFGFIFIVGKINHIQVTSKQVFNLTFYALLPMGLVFGACFVFSLLSVVFGSIMLYILVPVALLMTVILLYNGFLKFANFEVPPFYSFTLFSMVLMLVFFIILVIDISTGVASAISSASSQLGDLFSSYGPFGSLF